MLLWITLTNTQNRVVAVNAAHILQVEEHGTHRVAKLDGLIEKKEAYTLEVRDKKREIINKIKREWQSMCEFEKSVNPRGPIKPTVRKPNQEPDGWSPEHEVIKGELIRESPDLFPNGEVPKHLLMALNSHVTVYVRHRRELYKAELEDLLDRIRSAE